MVKYADNDDLKAFILLRDINDKKTAELELIQRSATDSLTGIMNRASYVDAVNSLMSKESSRRHVLAMMDVDYFKQVNDTFGHDKGDEVLRDVAANIKKILREGDLLGRIGGDEFSFCFVNISEENFVDVLLERVRSALNHEICKDFVQSVSIGAVIFDSNFEDFSEIYKKADIALYQAKKKGKNTFVIYEPHMHNA